jgi:hypothetical protein
MAGPLRMRQVRADSGPYSAGGTIRADGVAPNTHEGETVGIARLFTRMGSDRNPVCYDRKAAIGMSLLAAATPHGDLIAKNGYLPFLWSLRMFGLNIAAS